MGYGGVDPHREMLFFFIGWATVFVFLVGKRSWAIFLMLIVKKRNKLMDRPE